MQVYEHEGSEMLMEARPPGENTAKFPAAGNFAGNFENFAPRSRKNPVFAWKNTDPAFVEQGIAQGI